jgi:hypothetical protein
LIGKPLPITGNKTNLTGAHLPLLRSMYFSAEKKVKKICVLRFAAFTGFTLVFRLFSATNCRFSRSSITASAPLCRRLTNRIFSFFEAAKEGI